MVRRLAITAALAAALSATSCGGGSTLSIWKVSSIVGDKPASCYPGGKITDFPPPTTTIETYQGDWELYQASKGTYQLRIDTKVYDGTDKGGGAYSFEGLKSDKTPDRIDSPTKTTTHTVTQTFALQVDGDTMTGTWTHLTTDRCDGGGCPTTYQDDHPDCTTTDQLRGTRVDIQIYHQE